MHFLKVSMFLFSFFIFWSELEKEYINYKKKVCQTVMFPSDIALSIISRFLTIY